MTAPRFLFITADVPRNGGSGGQIVSWRLLEAYARRGDVDVLALAQPDADPSPELRALAARVQVVPVAHFRAAHAPLRTAAVFTRALVSREPFRIAKFESAAARRVVRDWSLGTEYGAVHCDHLSTVPYRGLVPGSPAVLGQHDVEWQQFSQLAARHRNPLARAALRADSGQTRRWEAAALDEFSHVLTLSETDRGLLLDERPDLAARISVWPIPVKVAVRPPLPPAPPTFLALGALTSVGRREGLRWLVSEVWPAVRAAATDARLEVVGADPPRDLRARDGRDGIGVHGFVEDVEPFLARAHACVIPLFIGSGIRVKVLEAIARGIPCVGTPIALRGLAALGGCTEAADAAEFQAALTAVALDPDGARGAAERGAEELARTHTTALADASLGQALEAAGVAPAGQI